MDDEDFLAAVEADNANAPATEPTAEPATPVEPATPTLEPEPPAPAEPAPAEPVVEAPAAPAQPEPIMVPLAALHETRDELKTLKEQLAKLQPQPQAPQFEIPDRYEDPEGFEAYQEARTQQALLNTRLDLSEDMARERHGDELVEKAKNWALERFRENPAYQAEVLSKRNPYSHVVSEFQRHAALARIGDPSRIDAFLKWEAAQAQIAAAPPGAAPPNPAPSIPPRSLASAPSAGGIATEIVQSDQEIFEEVMPKR